MPQGGLLGGRGRLETFHRTTRTIHPFFGRRAFTLNCKARFSGGLTPIAPPEILKKIFAAFEVSPAVSLPKRYDEAVFEFIDHSNKFEGLHEMLIGKLTNNVTASALHRE